MSQSADSLRAFMSRGGGPEFTPTPGVVVVGSGKGGAGVSSIALLLAEELNRQDQHVLLVDGDEHVGSLHLLLGWNDAGPGLGALRGGTRTPAELLREVRPGLHLLPGGSAGAGGSASLSTAERRALFRRVGELYEHYDMVIVDGGARLESVTAALGAGAERLLAVTGTDRVSLAASYALVKVALARFQGLPVELVVNRTAGPRGSAAHRIVDGAAERFLRLSVPMAGDVPDDPALTAAFRGERGFADLAWEHPSRQAATRLVSRLMHDQATRDASAAKVLPLRGGTAG
jgi:MinD-like ATPase involved in chromosome partitioning or flagellar assembly